MIGHAYFEYLDAQGDTVYLDASELVLPVEVTAAP